VSDLITTIQDIARTQGLFARLRKGEMQPTSKMAFKSVNVMTIQEKILCELKITDLTDDELEQTLDMRHQTVSACRRGLVKAGLVNATGDTRPTRSGRQANVWCLTMDGLIEFVKVLERGDGT